MTTANTECVTIDRCAFEEADWSKLVRKLVEKAEWSLETQVFSYEESVKECTLEFKVLRDVIPAADAFEGRLFWGQADVRWMPRTEGGYIAWLVRESPRAPGPDSIVVTSRERSYFLLGVAAAGAGPLEDGNYAFEEGRYPGKVFKYPVRQQEPVTPGDRAYIEVIEYELPAPPWPNDVDAIEGKLNQPILVAHRFNGVRAGRSQ
jgi:hypothetical protein